MFWTLSELTSSLPVLLTQLTEFQKLPSPKRKEENNKFVFKRFFKFLQKEGPGGRLGFMEVFNRYLSSNFDISEIDTFFKPTKEHKPDATRLVAKKGYFIPFKLNHAFLRRLFEIGPLMTRLYFYLDHILLEQVKEEIKTKSLKFMSQFKTLYETTKNYEIFSDAIHNYALDCQHKNLWSVGEVKSVIADLKARIDRKEVVNEGHANGFEDSFDMDLPSSPVENENSLLFKSG